MEIVAKFGGGTAERYLLPAYEGTQSIEGIARAITLVAHYVVTGEVRKRYPFSEDAKLYLAPSRAGSFESFFSLWTQPDSVLVSTAVGAVAVGVVSMTLFELLKYLTKTLIGQDDASSNDRVRYLLDRKSGDIEVLSEAIEPSIKKSHNVINNGAGNIVVISGSNNIVTFNARSKEYIFTQEEDNEIRQLLVSCGMLNVNTRTDEFIIMNLAAQWLSTSQHMHTLGRCVI